MHPRYCIAEADPHLAGHARGTKTLLCFFLRELSRGLEETSCIGVQITRHRRDLVQLGQPELEELWSPYFSRRPHKPRTKTEKASPTWPCPAERFSKIDRRCMQLQHKLQHHILYTFEGLDLSATHFHLLPRVHEIAPQIATPDRYFRRSAIIGTSCYQTC